MKFNKEYVLKELDGGVYSVEDLLPLLNSRQRIRDYVKKGYIQKIARGYYSVNAPFEREILLVIQKYFSGAVLCDHSALYFNNLSDYLPNEFQFATPPQFNHEGFKDIYFKKISSEKFFYGINKISVNGVLLDSFTPERCLFEIAGDGPNSETYLKVMINYYKKYGFKEFDEILHLSHYYSPERFLIINNSLQILRQFQSIH